MSLRGKRTRAQSSPPNVAGRGRRGVRFIAGGVVIAALVAVFLGAGGAPPVATIDATPDPQGAATPARATDRMETPDIHASFPAQARVPGFAGSATCATCHATEAALWKNSHHAKAMQHANPDSVLGDFEGAQFVYFGTTSTFFRREGTFMVRTDGPDGKLAEFRISHAFGVSPLQQYLVAFPDGRLQALPIAWDARPEAEGGQRWFHLYPDAPIRAGDPLHWTRREQNWNWMCAECHSTALARGYDVASNTYATTYAEMNVGCEACHGPGERHLDWAKAGANAAKDPTRGLSVSLDERRGVQWTTPPSRSIAVRNREPGSRKELMACAQCHARRAPLAGGLSHSGDIFETHDLTLLVSPLYHVDGQQRGEVYNTGSFMSSRMYAKGVTCSDCHEPHGGTLRATGNAVCSQCHLPASYDTPAHTLHPAGSHAAACTSCHMPTTNYMVVDARHDHSFRVPRPDLSMTLGTPNACNQCHRENDAAWASEVITRHFGPDREGFQTFGPAFHAAEQGAPEAEAALLAVFHDGSASSIARASALARLAPLLSMQSLPALEEAASDADPLLRSTAMDTLLSAPPQERLRIAATRLDDASRIVRIKAARALAIAPDAVMTGSMRAELQPLFDDWIASQRVNADRPEPLVNLGLFHTDRRDPAAAETAYRQALRLEPDFVPAWVNLADLYRASGRETDAGEALAAGLARAGDNPDLLHAMGLLRIRQGRRKEALELLQRSANLAPQNPRYAFVLGVALHDSGQGEQAIEVLASALARFPDDRDLLGALAGYTEASGDSARARMYRDRLTALDTGSR